MTKPNPDSLSLVEGKADLYDRMVEVVRANGFDSITQAVAEAVKARSVAQALLSAEKREAELRDSLEGTREDLRFAVEVAFSRGAEEWTRLNYPALYAQFTASRSLSGEGT